MMQHKKNHEEMMNITNGREEGAPKASVPMEVMDKTGHGTKFFISFAT